jgi:ectoine hydroxylase-related dioxygenase (phytanoyl-CoA dioxygenase family)
MAPELIQPVDLTQGYGVAPQVLAEGDIAGLRGAITETLDRAAGALRTPYGSSRPDLPLEERLERVARENRAYAAALYHAVMADAQEDPRVQALAEHPRLSGLVKNLLAPETVMGHTLRVRAVLPSFSGERTAWHQDVVRPSTRGCGSVKVACWMPLSDADETGGALELMPGPWRAPLPHQSTPDGRFHIAEADLPAGPRRVVPVRRGDVLLLAPLIPHRALPVRGDRARWTVVMWVQAC